MKFSVLTLFPEMIKQTMQTSITGRALQNDLFELNLIQIRDFAVNKYGKVDDYLFGGGKGMLMMPEPVFKAWEQAANFSGANADSKKNQEKTKTIYFSPKGKVFGQSKAVELSEYDHVIMLCGHYEGVDQRVLDEIVDEEISLGDFVLTGGELAACVVMDAVSRLLPGVLPDEQAYLQESHMQGLLEQPHYTRPAKWHNKKVPEILLSGHQAKIQKWQYLQSLRETMKKRPDLFARNSMARQDWQELIDIVKQEQASDDI